MDNMESVALTNIKNAHINLCMSCRHTYPECPSDAQDALFGNFDNICACAKFEPFAEKPRKNGKWIDSQAELWGETIEGYECSICGARWPKVRYGSKNFCPNCGATNSLEVN